MRAGKGLSDVLRESCDRLHSQTLTSGNARDRWAILLLGTHKHCIPVGLVTSLLLAFSHDAFSFFVSFVWLADFPIRVDFALALTDALLHIELCSVSCSEVDRRSRTERHHRGLQLRVFVDLIRCRLTVKRKGYSYAR